MSQCQLVVVCFVVFNCLCQLSVAQTDTTSSGTQNTVDRLIKRGVSRSSRGDNEGALADFNKAIETDPKSAEAYFQRGQHHFGRNEYDQSLVDVTKAIEIDGNLVDARFLRGKCHANLSKYVDAVSDFDKYISIKSTDAIAFNWRGYCYDQLSNLDLAIQDFTHAIEMDPKYVNALTNRASSLRRLGLAEKAIEDNTRILELAPNSADALYFRGYTKLYGTGDLEGAMADITAALKLDSNLDSHLPYLHLATSHFLQGQDAAAQEKIAEYLKLEPKGQAQADGFSKNLVPVYKGSPSPKSAQDYYKRANQLYNVSHYNKAVFDYQHSVALDDFNADAWYWLGMCLGMQGFQESKINTLKKCLEADDRYTDAYYQLGEVYRYNLDRNADSIPFFKKAVEIKPDYASAYESLATALSGVGELPEALKMFNKAIELNPRSNFALTGRAEAHLGSGEPAKAMDDINKSFEMGANSSYALRIRGRVKSANRDYPGALADFDESLKGGDNAHLHKDRGITFLRMGKTAEAEAEFSAARKMNPKISVQLDKEIAQVKNSVNKK